MHKVPLLAEVVRMDEHVIPATSGCDEPISPNVVKTENPAYSHHAYHLS